MAAMFLFFIGFTTHLYPCPYHVILICCPFTCDPFMDGKWGYVWESEGVYEKVRVWMEGEGR